MDRYCKLCEKKLVGRVDKLFCSAYCRIQYHNEELKQKREVIKKINAILLKNWNILTELNISGKTLVPELTLLNKGFNFNYYTKIYTAKSSNKTYHVCYDQAYCKDSEQGMFMLKDWKP
ncbi:MAG: hypothetical protein JXJ22_06275 [Bacteroidales bacterium]|nr:hypothetical protein [Bacteroidales bacterium]